MTIEDKAEALGFKEGGIDKCICGHAERVHVPFSPGDQGWWYGCVQCDKESISGACKFYIKDHSNDAK